MPLSWLIKAMVQGWTRTPKPFERYPVEIASGQPIPDWNLTKPLKHFLP